MLLTVDIGNTNITIGVYDSENLINTYRMASDKSLTSEEYTALIKETLSGFQINGCIIGSVVTGLDEVIKKSVDSIFNIESIVLSTDINTGVVIKLDNKKQAGADRIANAYAAKKLYKLPAIVVDFGTATTFDIVNEKSEFIGGIIAPGLRLQLETLGKCTSKLPQLNVQESKCVIGSNTEDAILSGVVRGTASMIEGLINECEKELKGKATIIATGGYCSIIAQYMNRKFDFVNQSLTLEGLKYLFELNENSRH